MKFVYAQNNPNYLKKTIFFFRPNFVFADYMQGVNFSQENIVCRRKLFCSKDRNAPKKNWWLVLLGEALKLCACILHASGGEEEWREGAIMHIMKLHALY